VLSGGYKVLHIDLSFNSFREIPGVIYELQNLQTLCMTDNMINSIPLEIAKLTHLKSLILSHNSIYFVHSSINKLKELTVFSLNNNCIEEWPITSLTDLRCLYLHDNQNIQSIPLCFAEFLKLVEFSFDWYEYLPDVLNKVLNGARGIALIIKTRNLCKYLAQQKAVNCTFTTFLDYFVTSIAALQTEIYPLQLATSREHNKILRLLIDILDVNFPDKVGQTALGVAMKERNKEAAEMLLSKERLDVNRILSNEGAAIHIALKYCWVDLVDIIITHPLFKPNIQDSAGDTALHILFDNLIICPYQQKALCKKLISNPNCDPNIKNYNNLTPLHCAARNNQYEYIRLCLEHNNNPKTTNKFDFNLLGGKNKFTVLHYIAVYSTFEILSEILTEDIDVLAKDKYGRTARSLLRHLAGRKLLLKKEKQQRRKELIKNTEIYLLEKTKIGNSLNSYTTSCMPTLVKMDDENMVEDTGNYTEAPVENGLANFNKCSDPRHSRNKKKGTDECFMINKSNVKSIEKLNLANLHRDSKKRKRNNKLGNEDSLKTQQENVLTFVNITNEEIKLITNKYLNFYNSIISGNKSKLNQLQLLLYLFSKADTDAKAILNTIIKNMSKSNTLFTYVQYLHKVLQQLHQSI